MSSKKCSEAKKKVDSVSEFTLRFFDAFAQSFLCRVCSDQTRLVKNLSRCGGSYWFYRGSKQE